MRTVLLHHTANVAAFVVAMGWDRFSVVLAVLVGTMVLGLTGKIDGATVVAIYGPVLGYVFGRTPTMGVEQRADTPTSTGGTTPK